MQGAKRPRSFISYLFWGQFPALHPPERSLEARRLFWEQDPTNASFVAPTILRTRNNSMFASLSKRRKRRRHPSVAPFSGSSAARTAVLHTARRGCASLPENQFYSRVADKQCSGLLIRRSSDLMMERYHPREPFVGGWRNSSAADSEPAGEGAAPSPPANFRVWQSLVDAHGRGP